MEENGAVGVWSILFERALVKNGHFLENIKVAVITEAYFLNVRAVLPPQVCRCARW